VDGKNLVCQGRISYRTQLGIGQRSPEKFMDERTTTSSGHARADRCGASSSRYELIVEYERSDRTGRQAGRQAGRFVSERLRRRDSSEFQNSTATTTQSLASCELQLSFAKTAGILLLALSELTSASSSRR